MAARRLEPKSRFGMRASADVRSQPSMWDAQQRTSSQAPHAAGAMIERAHFVRILVLGLALLLASPSEARSREQGSLPNFSVQTWGVAEGLPGAHVNGIAQDPDGFIWVATLAGLLRFDGHTFELFDEVSGDLPSSRLTVVHVGPGGRMWIGTEQGHVIEYRDHAFHIVAMPPYAGSRLATMVEDVHGTLWVSYYGDPALPGQPLLWQLVDGRMLPRHDLDRYWVRADANGATDAIYPDGTTWSVPWSNYSIVLALTIDAQGEAWGQLPWGHLVRLHDGLTDPVGPPFYGASAVVNKTPFTRSLEDAAEVFDPDGKHRIVRFPLPPWRNLFLVDRRGWAWVADGEHLLHAYQGDALEPVRTVATGSDVREVIEDRDGALWVGTLTKGLLRISEAALHVLEPEDGVPLPGAVGIDADGVPFVEPAPFGPCRAMYRVQDDRPVPVAQGCGWMLTDRSGVQWRFEHEDHNELVRVLPSGETASLAIDAKWMLEDPREDGVLWLVSERALTRVDGRGDGPPVLTDSWPVSANRAIVSDGDAGLWIGSTDGLLRLRGGELQRFGRAEGLPVDNVRALHPDGRGGLWLGTYGGGLVHFDRASFVTLGVDRGLPESVVSTLVEDRFGALWFAGNRGIHRIRIDLLEQALADPAARLVSLSFDSDDGLKNPETTGRPAALAPDGRVWFPTFGGLAVIDPAVVARQEQAPPQVSLRNVITASGVQRAGAPFTLDADAERSLEFGFTALHFAAPETLAFRYRLEPLDRDWIAADASRVARYRELAPGEYRFRVQARHTSGVWTEADATQSVTVSPLFTETNGFMILLVTGALGLIALAWIFATARVRRHAHQLEGAVQERTQALAAERDVVARQATRLGQLAEARSQFMAGISHELRTPLTLILGPLQDVYEERLGQLPQAARHEVATSLRNAERLRRLVDRLLGHARSEAALSRLQCREHELVGFVTAMIDELRPLAARRDTGIRVALPDAAVPVWIDSFQFESVLINLVANAIKYTPEGSEVQVSLCDDEGGNDAIVLAVRDNGPGIPDSDLPHLFERFYRGSDSGQSAEGGFGLGLALVHEVVERHGGRIDVATGVQGTTFSVHLQRGRDHLRAEDLAAFDGAGAPLQSPELAQAYDSSLLHKRETFTAGERAGRESDDDRTTILVVDDNAELRRLVRRQFDDEYRVLEAADGAQALAMLSERLPDLVLSDIMMPGLDGHELCRAIRANPETDFIPVVLLTAKASADSRIEGLQDGADAYLAKPFNSGVLRATVANLIASRQRLRERFAAEAQRRAVVATEPPQPLASDIEIGASDREYLAQVHAVIDANLHDEEFSVDDLARSVNQSRVSLYRYIKRLLDVSPSDMIREARLARASTLLAAGEGSVSEVAYGVGFKSTAHFSNSFLARFGTRPSSIGPSLQVRQSAPGLQ